MLVFERDVFKLQTTCRKGELLIYRGLWYVQFIDIVASALWLYFRTPRPLNDTVLHPDVSVPCTTLTGSVIDAVTPPDLSPDTPRSFRLMPACLRQNATISKLQEWMLRGEKSSHGSANHEVERICTHLLRSEAQTCLCRGCNSFVLRALVQCTKFNFKYPR